MSLLRRAVLVMGLVLVPILAASPASAGNRDRDANFGIYLGPDSFGLFITNHNRPWHHRGRYYDGHRYDRHYYRPYRGHDYRYGHWYSHPRHFYYDRRHRRHHARGCHPVYKWGYHNGHRAKVGGRMCYDRWGNPYVVRGSRHVIGYY